ncbi:HNH endonuclease [Microbacterium phage CrazyRich]|nr:HNH endonuclease [Microbacterium phage CrazyRich]
MTDDPTPQTRRLVLLRDAGRCVWCGRPWGDLLNLHHRLLRSHGTDNSPANLIAVCGSGTTGCHGAIHAHPDKARQRGHIVPSWSSPVTVPVLTWRGLLLLDDEGGASKHVPAGEAPTPPGGDFTAWPGLPDLGPRDRPSDRLSRWEPPV